MSKYVRSLLFGLIAMSFVLTACGTTATATQAPAAVSAMPADTAAPAMPAATTAPAAMTDWSKATSLADGGGMDALVAAAQKEGNLTVITLPRNWCDYGDMMDNFSKKYNIKIQDVNPDGGSADEV
jgi:putative spermidine/putrescine transport system substrate-binding protein